MKLFIGILFVNLFMYGCSTSEDKIVKRADKIHASILTVDTHCDTPMEFSDAGFDLGLRNVDGCVDFPKMVEGGLNVEFFVVFVAQGQRTDSADIKVHQRALEIISSIYKNVEKILHGQKLP